MQLPYNKSFHIITKKNIVIIWSAKSACTTVNYMYFTHENLIKKALKDTDWIHSYRKKYQKQQNEFREKYIQKIPPSRFIQFCVNPYRRAVSSYIHGMTRKYLPERHKNISFHEFLIRIQSGSIQPNPHHNQQTFYKNNYKLITTVKMEYMNEELNKINKKFNLHFKPYKNQNIKPKSNKINYFIGKLKWVNFKKSIPNNYTWFYDRDIKRLVEKIYNNDIKNLGYTWDMFATYESNKES
jgi:hypothetical protein